MRTRLLRFGVYAGLLLCLGSSATLAQPPPLEVSRHKQDFSVAESHVRATEALSVPEADTKPPRYDYRQARKVERAMLRQRRQFRRQNRRRNDDARRASYRKSQLQYRQYKREKRDEGRKPPNSPEALQPLDRRWRR